MIAQQDKSLSDYIKELIEVGKIYKFYKSKEWVELRQDILIDKHWECQECLKLGKYTRADCVHHVNEVKHRPELALSRYYIDKHGHKKENLVPLCNVCHNKIHEKLDKWQQKQRFSNEERW